MKVFKINLFERRTKISQYCNKCEILLVDGVGIFVEYRDTEYPNGFDEKTMEILSRSLRGISKTSCLVTDANTAEEAIEQFYNEWDGAKIGTIGIEDSFALYINKSLVIKEYPFCEKMHKNTRGRFICGVEEGDNGNGEFGMCVLENFDPPGFHCPCTIFNEDLYEADDMILLMEIAGLNKIERRMVGEFKIVKHKEL